MREARNLSKAWVFNNPTTVYYVSEYISVKLWRMWLFVCSLLTNCLFQYITSNQSKQTFTWNQICNTCMCMIMKSFQQIRGQFILFFLQYEKDIPQIFPPKQSIPPSSVLHPSPLIVQQPPAHEVKEENSKKAFTTLYFLSNQSIPYQVL